MKIVVNGYRSHTTARPREKTGEPDFAAWYDRLTENDPAVAYPAMTALAAYGDDSTQFLETKLQPARVEMLEINRLIDDLVSEEALVRKTALQKLLPQVRMIRKTLSARSADATSTRQKEEIESLLDHAFDFFVEDPEQLRQLRAIWCLEKIGTPRAARLLDRLGTGEEESQVTKEARISRNVLEMNEG